MPQFTPPTWGGTGDDRGFGIAVDSSFNAYVTGWTNSTNFPTTAGAFQTTFSGGASDAYVAKLNAAGSLAYSTFLGGSGSEDNDFPEQNGGGIAVDSAGDAWITGSTTSTNFPTTASAFQTTHGADGGNYDAFVTGINPSGTALVYSSYVGGTGTDIGQGIAIDSSGKVYVTGEETSAAGALGSGFPVTSGAYQTANTGSWDAFVVKVDPTQSGTASLVYSTLVGGNSDDYGQAIAVDSSGNAYITGFTNSAATIAYPTTAGAFQTTLEGSYDAFVTKVNASGTGLVYSTFLGGVGDDRGLGIAVDSAGNATAVGWTISPNFPVVNAIQSTFGKGVNTSHDAFVTRLNANGQPYYSTFLGGNGDDYANAVAVDSSGNVYVAGLTSSTNFPTAAALQATNAGGYDAFVAKITDTVTHAPIIAPVGTQNVTAGSTLTFTPAVSDPDIAATLSYSLSGTASAAGATYNNGVFSWNTNLVSPGSYSATIQVTASDGQSTPQTFNIIVNNGGSVHPAHDRQRQQRAVVQRQRLRQHAAP